ncbi:hypothetical protein [Aureimonas sp. N4]|uniref:hypothetical protein n=1 Tax=Aureimonas sp. N4 TaxID=1638165 RepID=UPI000786316B|nr:hypothetical protein [Aureimonas sp. N4]
MNSVFASAAHAMLLAMESQQAMHLRLQRLGLGGATAIDEADLMVREKVEAFGGALETAMAGGSVETVIRPSSVLQAP